MFGTLDLKDLEKRAFRQMYQDGLLDINIGLVVMSMALLQYREESDAFPFLRFGVFMLGLLLAQFVFWGGKKFITTPRMGQVRFGPQRRRRGRILGLVLGGIILVQVLIVAGTVLLWQNPQWASSLGLSTSNQDLERLVVGTIGALFVGPSFCLIAYFNDMVRGYFMAFIMSFGVFAMIWFANPIYLIIAGLLILIPGVVLFIRFLRQYPLPPEQIRNG